MDFKTCQHDFLLAIKLGFKNYLKFKGRSARFEFWYWQLFSGIFSFIVTLLDKEFFQSPFSEMGPAGFVFFCGAALPSLTVSVRRLHDIGKSGKWLFLLLLPVVGGFWLWVMFAEKSCEGENEFGPDPFEGRRDKFGFVE